MINDGDATVKSVSIGCCFIDENGNTVDQKVKDISIELKPNSSHSNYGTFPLVFENVKGKISSVEIYSATATYGITKKEERQAWLDKNWWIWLIIAYVGVGIVIGILCGVYIGADLEALDEDFWLSLLCGLFWPIGGIVLIIMYIKESKKECGYYAEDCDDYDEKCDNSNEDELYADDDSVDNSHKRERNRDKQSKEDNGIKREIPQIKMSDIAGLTDAKESFYDRVILPIKHKDIFEKYDKQTGGGILLYGLPGTGKTMFAQAVANELGASFFSIKCSDIMSKWYGESEANIKQLFAKARKEPSSVIFFDEFEAIGAKRKESSLDINVSTVQEILAQMQGVEKRKNSLLVLAATNCPWNIDSALLRPGRFNEKIYVPLPDKDARLFILKKELCKIKLSADINLEEIANRLDNYNGADVSEFCEQCKLAVIKKELQKKDAVLTKDDVEVVADKVHSSVLEEDIIKMEEFRKNNNI